MLISFLVLDVEDPALEDGGASFFDGDGGTATAVVVTDATIGVLSDEHFGTVIGIGYCGVGWGAGVGVSCVLRVDVILRARKGARAGLCFRFVAGYFMRFGV